MPQAWSSVEGDKITAGLQVRGFQFEDVGLKPCYLYVSSRWKIIENPACVHVFVPSQREERHHRGFNQPDPKPIPNNNIYSSNIFISSCTVIVFVGD
jgi:hypothetical protein